MRVLRAGAISVALALAGAVAVPASAQAQTPSVGDGIYTAAQAARGQALYDQRCVSCHGTMGAIVPEVAALLADHTFRNRWRGRTLDELFELIRETMPQDAPGTLSSQQSADLVAHILSGNRLPPGETALTDDVERLRHLPFEP